MRILKGILKIFFLLLILLLVASLAYLVYFMAGSRREEDEKTLDVAYCNDRILPVGGEYSVLSWNAGFGAYGPDFSFFMEGGTSSRAESAEVIRNHMAGMIETIQGLDPDFLLMQEIDTDADRSWHVDESYLLIRALEGYSSTFATNYNSPYVIYPFASPMGKAHSGIMTFSKYCMENSARYSLPVEKGFSRYFDLDRCYTVSKVKTDAGNYLCVFNVHLSAYTRDGTVTNEQIRVLSEHIRREYDAGNYVICGGDFNKNLIGSLSDLFGNQDKEAPIWTTDFPKDLLDDKISLVAPFDENDPLPSVRNADKPYSSGENYLALVDGFLVSSNVKVTRTEVVNTGFAYSDHNPVVMRFTLQ